ncbi:hypothetical protein EYE42_01170 [Paracoccus subflavus]|uniref:DUF3035 domain-containing protein n=1 Tax=Paracoccus subflavus TaxID=2528244 RepID=A0A4Q9GAG2_9RHOB|nr:hypothetical protein [Paracoccus subflavus]TBN43775.1 hypothetical protein EYE42_01170 [Paracoccus subflavus]
MKPGPILILCLLVPPGCQSEGDDYPRLLPTDVILAEPVLPDHAPAATAPGAVRADTAARADALRQRADALRGPVIEPETLARMQ